ncbi:MAG TPA: hypothetical protein VIJ43_13110, partial [Burkholderiales bacterium]
MRQTDLRAARANRVFCTDEKRIRTENTVRDKNNKGFGLVCIQDRRLRTDVFFIRAQSTIRADGAPSAQVRSLQLDVWSYVARFRRSGHCALARANRVFGTDEKRIRTKNTVIDKSKNVTLQQRSPPISGDAPEQGQHALEGFAERRVHQEHAVQPG